uniref:Uncharacterized protein n=1 Tax=Oryza brachyantha TaxID=4533 RepID=J3LGL2_ORYBR
MCIYIYTSQSCICSLSIVSVICANGQLKIIVEVVFLKKKAAFQKSQVGCSYMLGLKIEKLMI